MGKSHLEETFEVNWEYRYPDIDLEAEYRFHSVRKFRFDFAHPGVKVAIECQGGIWTKSGHSSGNGLKSDYEKFCLAAACGWLVFPMYEDMLKDDYWLALVAEAIRDRARVQN